MLVSLWNCLWRNDKATESSENDADSDSLWFYCWDFYIISNIKKKKQQTPYAINTAVGVNRLLYSIKKINVNCCKLLSNLNRLCCVCGVFISIRTGQKFTLSNLSEINLLWLGSNSAVHDLLNYWNLTVRRAKDSYHFSFWFYPSYTKQRGSQPLNWLPLRLFSMRLQAFCWTYFYFELILGINEKMRWAVL